MDGRALLSALRIHPETALIPVIFLSAHAGAEARVEALLESADDYLCKPFQLSLHLLSFVRCRKLMTGKYA